MDERQRQVSMGAGLEESRLNKEFIDFLGKWGPRVLTVLLVIVAAYQGKNWLDNRAANAENDAYGELSAVLAAGSPAEMLRVADEHRDRRGIFVVANLEAGKALLNEGVRGMINNAINPLEPTEDELIDEEGRKTRFEQAKAAFEAVRSAGGSGIAADIHQMQGLSGLASAHASLGEYDEAKALLEELVALANEKNFPDIAAYAGQRLAEWDRLASVPVVLNNDDLPEWARLPETAAPDTLQMGNGITATRVEPGSLPPNVAAQQPATPQAPGDTEPNVLIESFDPEEVPSEPASTPDEAPEQAPEESPEG